MPPPYRGVILDADNTLFDFSRSQRESLEAVLEDHPHLAARAHAPFETANQTVWHQYENGKITSQELRVKRFQLLFEELEISADPDVADERYVNVLATKAYLLPGALELLRYLASRMPVVLGTNGLSSIQRGRVRRAGISRFFTGMVISDELGTPKPERGFFEACLSFLEIPRRSALMVGDSATSDIRGALQAGIDACWYNPERRVYPPGEPEPTWTVLSLLQIQSIVR